MIPFRRNQPIENMQRPQPPSQKSCKRIIKRDDKGRIKSEEFKGCTKEEVKIMRESDKEEPEDY